MSTGSGRPGAGRIDYLADLTQVVRRALEEDVGSGDVTAALIPAARQASARIITREAGVLCGRPWFDEVFRQLDPAVRVRWQREDGAGIEPDELLCELAGPARSLVTGERTALNFLQTLSGTATTTRAHASLLAGTGTRLLDTRKTLPGLRLAQKYAVRCGQGHNHRIGLYDGILIKENHLHAAGSIAAAVATLRRTQPGLPIEVEVETLAQLDEAVAAGAEMVLLDNFDLGALGQAVARAGDRVLLEASGGFERDELAAVAATGVHFISVGSLTKHVRALDLSMRFE